MTVEAEQTPTDAAPHDGVGGAVVHVLIDLVHGHNGDVGVAQALALAGEDRSFAALGDSHHWSSLDQAVALFHAASLVTGDGAVGLHVGEALLFADDRSGFVGRLRALGSPDSAYKHVGPLVATFDTTCDAVALEVAADHALIRVTPRPPGDRHAHLCEMTRGLLSQVPVLYGLGPALISEAQCGARGSRSCLYALSWDGPGPDGPDAPGPSVVDHPVATVPDPDPDPGPDPGPGKPVDESGAEELRSELDRMSALIEGAFATASQLVSDDVNSLLSQIAARADAVVGSRRYLLMIRVRAGTPIQLHYRGLEPDEAQTAAAELWREHPDDDGGSRLIVDIASPERLYGRLAEFIPGGEFPEPSEVKVLRLFAEYAATALDVFTVLSDAKRSDATARTLLSFAETLSRVTTLAELVQLLVNTVPAVTDCDQSTVYLWDSDRGQLTPRAWTEGAASPDGALVPIAPDGRRPTSIRFPLPPVNGGPVSPIGPGAPPGPAGQPAVGHPHDPDVMTVGAGMPLIDQLIRSRQVVVLDRSTDDHGLLTLLEGSGTAASVVAPLFAGGEFLGVIAANFVEGSSTVTIRDADLHERLSGLADQAATTLQNLELLERVSHLAWHDALTGLPNRRLFEDRVEQELVRSRRVGEPVCMFFVDLDHFKTVNDSLGHAAGDDLIRQVSQRLVDTVRRQDTVARVGGDEFAILLPGLSDQFAIDQLAQRSLEAMSRPYEVAGVEVETSASIGIAMAPDHGDSYDELLSRADEAMYQAKSRGRNAFQMYSGSAPGPPAGPVTLDRRTLHADLAQALDRSEFFVLYQPYIDLRTGRVVGVEALVRWNHPTLGVLEPSAFIPLAEQDGTVVALDSWVLAEACRQLRTWIDRGLGPLRLSVNLASRDLSDPDLSGRIDRILSENRIDPSLLELEITERVARDSSGPSQDTIERLRRLGVRFTIDDVGTGHSPLSRIGSFPVSTLKIDRSFVQVLGPDGDSDGLVSAIIAMAERLGLTCVAEGVETSAQSRVLLQRGCTTAQGYFFSPPLPAGDIELMMAGIATNDGRPSVGDAAG